MRSPHSSPDAPLFKKVQLLCSFFVSGILISMSMFSCSSVGPDEAEARPKTLFTAADSADIRALATMIYPAGTIQSITIRLAPEPVAQRTVDGLAMSIIMPSSNEVTVTYAPELVAPRIKCYRSLSMWHTSWQESALIREDALGVVKNNWATSVAYLLSHDKTVLALDSCTIEATLTGANVDTVIHLLNMISEGRYTLDSTQNFPEPLDVEEVSSVDWSAHGETGNVNIRCNRWESFRISYINGNVRFINYAMILCQGCID